jgi:signal transduction histidine kinase
LGFFSADKRVKEIEERLAEASRQIDTLRYEARLIADSAKIDVMANIGHELRAPFNAIIGFTEMILDRQFGDLTSLQEEYLGDVLQSARNLFALVNDVLDLSKIEVQDLKLELSVVNLDNLIARCLALVKEKALKHGIKLKTETNQIDETIVADEHKLKRILFNLLSGAIQLTPDGGEVRLEAAITEQDVSITVEDTGCGIREQDLGRIFDPLQQADSFSAVSCTRRQPGLHLTQKLVELHGGRIWAESEGEGARFRLLIPKRQSIDSPHRSQEVRDAGAYVVQ